MNGSVIYRFASCVSSMKRTRTTSKAKVGEKKSHFDETGKSKVEVQSEDIARHKIVQRKNIQNEGLKTLRKAESQNGTIDIRHSPSKTLLERVEGMQEKNTDKLNLKSLRDRNKKVDEEYKPNSAPVKNKARAVVDLEMMKEELKQLEDPPVTPWEKEICSARLQYSFYDSPCEQLAQNLLGKILVRCLENGTILKGRIVETEGYLGVCDKASHTYQNKVTPRNIPMYMPPGTIYVYMTYGMYHCLNVSSQGDGCAVLIRAVDPLEGIECMTDQRSSMGKSGAPKKTMKTLKTHELCNGPSKLCMAFQLQKTHSKYSMCTWKGLWIENSAIEEEIQIVACSRIGIDSCGPEWANKPLRYYVHGNKSVSKRNKKAELLLGLN